MFKKLKNKKIIDEIVLIKIDMVSIDIYFILISKYGNLNHDF